MKKLFLISIFALAIFNFSFANATVDTFDYANDAALTTVWAVSGDDITAGGNAAITTSLAEKKEGTAAMKVAWHYSGTPWTAIQVVKNYPAGINLSTAKRFSIWINADDAAVANTYYYIRFVSSHGNAIRYLEFPIVASGWRKVDFNLTDLDLDIWVGYGVSDCPNINKITQIQLVMQHNGDSTPAGDAVFYFDDFEILDTPYVANNAGNEVSVSQIDGFNYASDAALESVWTATAANTGFICDIGTTTALKVEGSSAMQLKQYFVSMWENNQVYKTFSPAIDMTDVKFLQLWVSGQAVFPADSAFYPMIYLIDAAGNSAWAPFQLAAHDGEWSCLWFDFNIDSDGATGSSNAQFWQNDWDNGGDVDITQISKIGFFSQDNDYPANPPYWATIVLDDFGYGYLKTLSAKNTWSIYE